MNNEEMTREILKHWNPADHRCGRLIQKQDSYPPWVWHFAVGLSNDKCICWGGRELGSKGRLVICDVVPEYINTEKVTHLPLEEIKRRILGSVYAFHNERWLYSFPGWNCEHWARLVATGQPVCWQIGWPLTWFTNLHWRGEAIPHLAAHVI